MGALVDTVRRFEVLAIQEVRLVEPGSALCFKERIAVQPGGRPAARAHFEQRSHASLSPLSATANDSNSTRSTIGLRRLMLGDGETPLREILSAKQKRLVV